MSDNALSYAAQSGNLELVQWLANKGVGVTDQALCHAAQSGNLELVQWLVEQGADVHTSNRRLSQSALGAAVLCDHLDIVRYLIEQGAGVNESINLSVYESPLQLAVFVEDFEMVQYLVEHGANVNPGFRIIPYWYTLSKGGCDQKVVEYLKQRDYSLTYWGGAISLIVMAICSFVIYRMIRSKPFAEP